MTITTELVIARHGEATCNKLGIVGGETGCTGLTNLGREQATILANRLRREHATRPYDAFYTTPRLRVIQTADIVAARLDLAYQCDTDLRGPDHGDADGRLWADVKQAFGGPAHHRPDQPYAPGSDSWFSYRHRAHTALRRILTEHQGHRILIVGHGETIDAAHTMLLQLPANACQHATFWTNHTGISRWQRQINRFGNETWIMHSHNDIHHLP